MYVYQQSEHGLWTVGFYKPDGGWVPESDHHSTDSAHRRVAFLNGGGVAVAAVEARMDTLEEQLRTVTADVLDAVDAEVRDLEQRLEELTGGHPVAVMLEDSAGTGDLVQVDVMEGAAAIIQERVQEGARQVEADHVLSAERKAGLDGTARELGEEVGEGGEDHDG